MNSYQPFLIADFSTGLELGREPWLAPKDAFSTLKDAYVHNGVLQKRKGYTPFLSTGASLAITGIFHLVNSSGVKIQLVSDRAHLYQYSGGGLSKVEHDELENNPVWTGDASDFISWANWGGKVFMTNNKSVSGETSAGDGTGTDGIQCYDGSSFKALRPDVSGSGDYVDRCAFILVHKERMILFSTEESGARLFQRARWCRPGNPDDWTNDGFVDAPSSEKIMSVVSLRDDILVWFENSVWLLRYTADSDLPFRWEKVSSVDGCGAPHSGVSLMDQGLALGKAGPVMTDGLTASRVDQKIPDIALTFDQERIFACFGMAVEDQRQYWLLHPSIGSGASDQVLSLNYENWSWSIFNLGFNCMGFHTQGEAVMWLASPPDPAMDMSGQTWAECPDPWVSGYFQAGYPVVLAGDYSGGVHKVNHSGTDGSGGAISFEAKSGRWNPYKDSGRKARLGFVDFLVETGSSRQLNADFFKDAESTPYQTRVLDCDRDGEKAWIRLFSGASAHFHRIRLHHCAGAQSVKIHAVMPWFKPV